MNTDRGWYTVDLTRTDFLESHIGNLRLYWSDENEGWVLF